MHDKHQIRYDTLAKEILCRQFQVMSIEVLSENDD